MAEPSTDLLGRLFRHDGVAIFAACFLLVLGLKWSALNEPPVWDSAMGIFPAAIVLSENGFDLGDLLDQPGFMKGGPNNHPFSMVTWATALVIQVLGDSPALFPTLHLIHFVLTALAIFGLYRFAQPLLGRRLAALTCGAVLFFPVFLTQSVTMYFEMPLTLCTIHALTSWSRGHPGRASLWAALASMCKESGIIVGLTLAAAALLERRPLPGRLMRCVSILALPLLLVILQTVFLVPVEEAAEFEPPTYREFLLNDVWSFLRAVPDLTMLLTAFVLLAIARAASGFRFLCESPENHAGEAESADYRRGLTGLIVFVFLSFYLAFPLTGVEMHVLPRYYIQIIPFLFLGLTDAGKRLLTTRGVAISLLFLIFLFVANGKGKLYYPPVPANEFAIAERSAEYVDLLSAQRQGLDALVAVSPETPIFFAMPEHYLLSYPLMGYVDETPANGHCIPLDEPYRNAR